MIHFTMLVLDVFYQAPDPTFLEDTAGVKAKIPDNIFFNGTLILKINKMLNAITIFTTTHLQNF